MDGKRRARYEARARIVKALAHPTRLFLVDELTRGERCVCELAQRVGADISTVSKHLAVLRAAGVVEDEKRGSQVYYRLRCPCLADFFGCIEAVLKSNAQREASLLR